MKSIKEFNSGDILAILGGELDTNIKSLKFLMPYPIDESSPYPSKTLYEIERIIIQAEVEE